MFYFIDEICGVPQIGASALYQWFQEEVCKFRDSFCGAAVGRYNGSAGHGDGFFVYLREKVQLRSSRISDSEVITTFFINFSCVLQEINQVCNELMVDLTVAVNLLGCSQQYLE